MTMNAIIPPTKIIAIYSNSVEVLIFFVNIGNMFVNFKTSILFFR